MEPKKQEKPKHTYGKWIYKVTASAVLICECGGKYLKTRAAQTSCLTCARNK